MLRDVRNLLWLLPVAAVLTLPLWKPVATNLLNPVRQQAVAPAPFLSSRHMINSSTMTGVNFEQSKNGTREWLLTADRFSSLEDDPTVQLENVRARFFNNDREGADTKIQSQQASYNTETQQIVLEGKVRVINEQGYEMESDTLQYLAAEKKISSTSPVSILGDNFKINGDQLVYDTITGNYTLSGHVRFLLW